MDLKPLLLSSVLAFSCATWAQQSCLPEFTSLQASQAINLDSPEQFIYPLKSENTKGLFVSKAQLVVNWDPATRQMSLRLRFDPSFTGVSLAYNFYSLLVLQNGAVVDWVDLTNNCTAPGVSLFPGQTFNIPAAELCGSGVQNFQFMVWGRL